MPIDASPRVFVSYSWDSEEHKNWVLAFVNQLRQHSIDAFIDQTHLPLGARTSEFMERSVRESDRVLVVCTDIYKHRFDNRKGGTGYESHIITDEIVNEVGKNKFIPVLRSGDWKSALPTGLLGIYGVDLRNDSLEEFRKLVENLHGISRVSPIGARPAWPHETSKQFHEISATSLDPKSDPNQYWEQRKKLPDTDLMKTIWSKPRWRIWIRPTQFRRARFQSVEHCRAFMLSSYVCIQGWFSYPWISPEKIEIGDEWVAGEIDHHDNGLSRMERWALFRSAQFVHNRALDQIPQLGDRVHT